MYRGIKVKINAKLYYKISLDGVTKYVIKLFYDSRSPYRGSNRDLPCYEAGELTVALGKGISAILRVYQETGRKFE
jgi:hypothetical protein